jgi:hypothetical protein
MSLEGLDLGILGPAFLAGLLVLSTHVPLGQEVLARCIIFIDLAIAQIAWGYCRSQFWLGGARLGGANSSSQCRCVRCFSLELDGKTMA